MSPSTARVAYRHLTSARRPKTPPVPVAPTPIRPAPRTPEGIIQAFLTPYVKDPDEADSVADNVMGHFRKELRATLQKTDWKFRVVKWEGRGGGTDSRTDEGVRRSTTYSYFIEHPTSADVRFGYKANLVKRWNAALTGQRSDFASDVPDPTPQILDALTEVAKEEMDEYTSTLFAHGDPPENVEEMIEDQMWSSGKAHDEVSTSEVDSEGNETELPESASPEYHFRFEAENPVIQVDRQGDEATMVVLVPVQIRLRKVALIGDYDYGRRH